MTDGDFDRKAAELVGWRVESAAFRSLHYLVDPNGRSEAYGTPGMAWSDAPRPSTDLNAWGPIYEALEGSKIEEFADELRDVVVEARPLSPHPSTPYRVRWGLITATAAQRKAALERVMGWE